MRAIFTRKEPYITAGEFVVEKVIMLPKEQYIHFTKNLMDNQDFISENKDLMYEEDGIRHCILVTGEGMDEGVLVESEGAAYARYSAFVPSVLGIMQEFEMKKDIAPMQEMKL